MRNKSYVESNLDAVSSTMNTLINDIENDKYYVNKQYLLERLEYLKKLVILVQDRVQLEDDKP